MKLKDTVHFNLKNQLLIVAVILVLLYLSALATDANFVKMFQNIDQMTSFLGRFLQPDFGYIPNLINPMIKTLQMSVTGTILGVLLATPFAFMATTIVTNNKIITTIFRVILDIIRTIPTLLLGALLVAILGIGEFTGVVTIAIFTFGMVSQLIYAQIETIDYSPIEAATSVGASKLQIVFWAILPQVFHAIIGYTLYAFEVNVRASTILGYVGAGGVGVMLSSALALLRYDRVSIIILLILVIVILVDYVSELLRRRYM